MDIAGAHRMETMGTEDNRTSQKEPTARIMEPSRVDGRRQDEMNMSAECKPMNIVHCGWHLRECGRCACPVSLYPWDEFTRL